MNTEVRSRPPGRPRSEKAEKAIIEATLDLLADRAGVAGVSIEAVAARAGVGKTTIYRRWPNKEALIVDALASLKPPLPQVDEGSVRADLVKIAEVFTEESLHRHARCVWNVLGSASRFPGLLEQYKAQVIAPRQAVMSQVMRRAVDSGEIRADADLEIALSMFVGALTLHLRSWDPQAAVPEDFNERLVDGILTGLAPR